MLLVNRVDLIGLSMAKSLLAPRGCSLPDGSTSTEVNHLESGYCTACVSVQANVSHRAWRIMGNTPWGTAVRRANSVSGSVPVRRKLQKTRRSTADGIASS